MKFKCKKCGNEIEKRKVQFTFKGKEMIVVGVECCGEQMEYQRESNGFGGIISKPGGTIGSL